MFKKLNENAKLPTKAHGDDVGYDLYALEDVVLDPQEVTKVRTGIAYGGFDALNHGTANFVAVFPKIEGRSGLASKGIFPVGGIVDPGYRGEIAVMLFNSVRLNSNGSPSTAFKIEAGDRIAQIVFYMTAQPDVSIGELKQSERGDAGFGSTGK
jgi:dUTP pyrophosphatase